MRVSLAGRSEVLKNKYRELNRSMKDIIILSFALLLAFLAGCKSEPTAPELERYTWKASSPQAQNINPQVLELAFVQANLLGFVDGLLVIRNGFIVAEEYYNGYSVNTPHNIKSVSKSFLSVIVGLANEQGYIENLDQKVLDYFPEYAHAGMDEKIDDVTIRHLLTMQMGIDSESDRNYELYSQIYRSDNWIKTTLELPLVYNPGEGMRYNTFQTHLLSAIITKTTGKSTLQYAKDNLFTPIGIDIDDWEQGPQGYYFGGNSMYFTPREMATLGLLYLNDGRLNDNQIVPGDWIDISVTKTWADDSPGWGVLTNYNYGYLWWLGQINNYELFMALGYGGQTVLFFPELDLIVVSTAEEDVPPDADQERPILKIVSEYILAAIII
jgi:CubicO group peptidase (beta-lactamase class C family)